MRPVFQNGHQPFPYQSSHELLVKPHGGREGIGLFAPTHACLNLIDRGFDLVIFFTKSEAAS